MTASVTQKLIPVSELIGHAKFANTLLLGSKEGNIQVRRAWLSELTERALTSERLVEELTREVGSSKADKIIVISEFVGVAKSADFLLKVGEGDNIEVSREWLEKLAAHAENARKAVREVVGVNTEEGRGIVE